jgi:transcriptional regulator with XRE-family HTH domain
VTEKALQTLILYRLKAGESLRDLEKDLGVSNGTLSRVARGIFPKTEKLRHKLGLAVMRPAPICKYCNEVHVKRCKGTFAQRLAHSDLTTYEKVGIALWLKEIRNLEQEKLSSP